MLKTGLIWGCLGLSVILAAVSVYSYGRINGLKAEVSGLKTKAEVTSGQLTQALESNKSLEEGKKECEALLTKSKENQREALEVAEQKISELQAKFQDKEKQYRNLMETTQCKSWAEQPSCVVP